MLKHFLVVLALAVLSLQVLACRSTAEASGYDDYEDAFTAGFALGGGSGSFSIEGDEAREMGVGGAMRLGYRFTPQFAVNLDIAGWSGDLDNTRLAQMTVTLTAQWFPSGRGLYLRGGAGFGAGQGEVPFSSGGVSRVEEGGVAGILGAGYEFRVNDRFGYGPDFQFGYIEYGASSRSNYGNLTFSFNWYL